ncbi:hypothetical protein [Sulfitobacter mediterraneus]|uniref:Uncharacterized protein n=1 Tax=Sulfitobacter mediterraneus TaxID=83219 RepID=A0A2T6CIL3_9RHOB|nr:hypothetical protein [Sulfitobacter mediterraneus]KIN76468.1 hypothetical protein Z950_1290 [Sulfitobacter mediterraneus KCTC 32188]PTX75343.1 hypothetical protein C8N31_102449 [Sulfitobacter mediterraneus]
MSAGPQPFCQTSGLCETAQTRRLHAFFQSRRARRLNLRPPGVSVI